MTRVTFFPSFLWHAFCLPFFVQSQPNWTKVVPKVSQNASQNRSRGISGHDFVIFFILTPLPHGIEVFMVRGPQKSKKSTEFSIKTAPRQKHTLAVHFYVKKRIFYKKVLQKRLQNHGERTVVFVTFSALYPQGRPRSAQGRPRSAQGCPRSAQRCPK